MNLGEIREAVRDDVEEETAAFWSDDLLNRYINRALRWVRSEISQLDEDFFDRQKVVTYPANSREVDLTELGFQDPPAAFLAAFDITDDVDRGTSMDHVNIFAEGLYRSSDEAFADLAGPAYYLTGGEGGQPVMGYRPIPQSNRSIRIYYRASTNRLRADNDTPDVPVDFHECIVLQAVILAKAREESPLRDYKELRDRVMHTAKMTLDGRHSDVDTRVHVTDLEMYIYT